MTAPAQLTPAQLTALRLASLDAIRYYKGGWYSVPDAAGNVPMGQYAVRDRFGGTFTTAITVRACVTDGWLDDNMADDIYARRWTLTPAGRAALDAAEVQS